VIAGLTYPLFHHAGQFVTAAVIAVAMALWTMALRQPAPGEGSEDAVAQASLEAG
jgi:hypothetical protein